MGKNLRKIVSLFWPKRRWCQYSLLTLLLVVTGICLPLGIWTERAYRQRVAVEALRRRNAIVEYDFQQRGFKESPWRSRLREFLGDDYLADVVSLDFTPRIQSLFADRKLWFEPPDGVSPANWKTPVFYNYPSLNLGGPFKRIPDPEPAPRYAAVTPLVDHETMRLAGALARLRILRLDSTNVTDLELLQIRAMSQLRELSLDGTGISDAGVVHLGGLRNLRRLSLVQTKVAGSGFAAFGRSSKLHVLLLSSTPFGDPGTAYLGKLQGWWNFTSIIVRGLPTQGCANCGSGCRIALL